MIMELEHCSLKMPSDKVTSSKDDDICLKKLKKNKLKNENALQCEEILNIENKSSVILNKFFSGNKKRMSSTTFENTGEIRNNSYNGDCSFEHKKKKKKIVMEKDTEIIIENGIIDEHKKAKKKRKRKERKFENIEEITAVEKSNKNIEINDTLKLLEVTDKEYDMSNELINGCNKDCISFSNDVCSKLVKKKKKKKKSILKDKSEISLENQSINEDFDSSLEKNVSKKMKANKGDTDMVFNEPDNGLIEEESIIKKKKKKKKKSEDLAQLTESELNALLLSSGVTQEASPPTPFETLRSQVSAPTMLAIESFGFTAMTEIQERSIPPLLEGKDIRGTAKTGSGKTLAFLIPAVELLHKMQFEPSHGTGVIVLSPTRELSMQSFSVVQQLVHHHQHLTHALLTGGTLKHDESKTLATGASVVVATPGRLLDHLQNTQDFQYRHLACLVLDEADKMLDTHFQDVMRQILALLPQKRQTLLFSATKNSKVNEMAQAVLKKDFVDIDVVSTSDSVTSSLLKQSYVLCPTEKKFLFLYKLLKRVSTQKSMVFFSCCDAVVYFHALLCAIKIPVLCIHGKQKQSERTASFNKFNKRSQGALLCTDVAARGWDIPQVDWIIQFDPPQDTREYIHRVGRTARGSERGSAMLLLREEEEAFIDLLQDKRCYVDLQPLSGAHLKHTLQLKLETLVKDCEYLSWSARQAFKTHLNSYYLHKLKDVFNLYEYDLKKLAQSFCLREPPVVDLMFEYKKSALKRINKRSKEGYYNEDEGDSDDELSSSS